MIKKGALIICIFTILWFIFSGKHQILKLLGSVVIIIAPMNDYISGDFLKKVASRGFSFVIDYL